jgi:hypothetical protein
MKFVIISVALNFKIIPNSIPKQNLSYLYNCILYPKAKKKIDPLTYLKDFSDYSLTLHKIKTANKRDEAIRI